MDDPKVMACSYQRNGTAPTEWLSMEDSPYKAREQRLMVFYENWIAPEAAAIHAALMAKDGKGSLF